MLAAGNNSRSLVIVRWTNGDTHMFHSEVVNNAMHYWDPQGDFNGLSNLLRLGGDPRTVKVQYYRTR